MNRLAHIGLWLCLALSGCVEISQTIQLQEDGSGQFTETVRFDDRLIQASKSAPELGGLGDILKEEQVKARLAAGQYGQATLVSHKINDLGSKGKEAVTVLAFKDVSKFTVPAMPSRCGNWPEQKLTFNLGEPVVQHEAWRNAYYLRRPLVIGLSPKGMDVGGNKNTFSPIEKEKLDALLPVVRSVMEGFAMSLRLEAFGPVDGGATTHTIYSLKAENLSDDDILLKAIQFNQFPDKYLGAKGVVGSGGTVRNEGYAVYIALPYTPEPTSQPARRRG